MTIITNIQKQQIQNNFTTIRDEIRNTFSDIEAEYHKKQSLTSAPSCFEQKNWDFTLGEGHGEMSLMRGNVFEKVGVNYSNVWGDFDPKFRNDIPGTEESGEFWAGGVSVVAHMTSPLLPALHLNVRCISTGKLWFGGGADMTPTFAREQDTNLFHESLKNTCDQYDNNYYTKFKEACDKYFYLPHRKEARGIGGIFFDDVNTDNWENDLNFVCATVKGAITPFVQIIRDNMYQTWSDEQKKAQLIKRGRYVEFNLLYDRGTKFGLMTGGNIDAILMSMPPHVRW